jgi:hypothetical protein
MGDDNIAENFLLLFDDDDDDKSKGGGAARPAGRRPASAPASAPDAPNARSDRSISAGSRARLPSPGSVRPIAPRASGPSKARNPLARLWAAILRLFRRG